jgi:polyhydroxyalkanoate synthase
MDAGALVTAVPARPAPLPDIEESLGIGAFRAVDRMQQALGAQLTGGLSPAALALAFFDWSLAVDLDQR